MGMPHSERWYRCMLQSMAGSFTKANSKQCRQRKNNELWNSSAIKARRKNIRNSLKNQRKMEQIKIIHIGLCTLWYKPRGCSPSYFDEPGHLRPAPVIEHGFYTHWGHIMIILAICSAHPSRAWPRSLQTILRLASLRAVAKARASISGGLWVHILCWKWHTLLHQVTALRQVLKWRRPSRMPPSPRSWWVTCHLPRTTTVPAILFLHKHGSFVCAHICCKRCKSRCSKPSESKHTKQRFLHKSFAEM